MALKDWNHKLKNEIGVALSLFEWAPLDSLTGGENQLEKMMVKQWVQPPCSLKNRVPQCHRKVSSGCHLKRFVE